MGASLRKIAKNFTWNDFFWEEKLKILGYTKPTLKKFFVKTNFFGTEKNPNFVEFVPEF